MEQIKTQFQPTGKFRFILKDKDGNVLKDFEKENLAVNAAKEGWAMLANGEAGFTGKISHLAVGTGANNPAITDTTLQTEIARTTPVGGTNVRTGRVLYMEFYFGPTEANANIKEVGVFIDGTAALNSGFLFDRTLLDITKDATNSLTIGFTLTIN